MREAHRDAVWSALRACRLWHGASDEAVDRLAAAATVSTLPRGAALATEGEGADTFGVLVTGRARVFHLQADGRSITYETVDRGGPLPAIAPLDGADLGCRLVNLSSVVQTLALDVPARLARYLFQRSLAVGEATAEGLRVSLGMPKSDLAASLGTVPETLSRALGRLRDDGILEVRGNDVLVLDVGALARLGSGYEE